MIIADYNNIKDHPQYPEIILFPMLFQDDMIRAMRSEKKPKTQTRRLITERNSACTSPLSELNFKDVVFDGKNDLRYIKVARDRDETRHRVLCKNEVGHYIWARETFSPVLNWDKCVYDFKYWYRADHEESKPDTFFFDKWRPNIFMPLVACRLFLQIKSIRPERLNEITEEDALAEGIKKFTKDGKLWKYGLDGWIWQTGYDPKKPSMQKTAISAYMMLWEHINGVDSWNKNPFVWVYEFERITIL